MKQINMSRLNGQRRFQSNLVEHIQKDVKIVSFPFPFFKHVYLGLRHKRFFYLYFFIHETGIGIRHRAQGIRNPEEEK